MTMDIHTASAQPWDCMNQHALTIDLSRAVPVKSFARGGDPDAAPSAHFAAKKIVEAARLQQSRPSRFCQPLSNRTGRSERLGDRQAKDCHPVAPCRFSLVRAMEVAMSRRQTEGAARNSPTDPHHEPRQPAVTLPGFMANSSSSASMLVKPRSPNTWQGTGNLHLKAGRRSSATGPM
jgi:hypothetical protein